MMAVSTDASKGVTAVLGRVSDEARRVAGQPPSGVVLTHPAAWSRTRLSVLAAAADRAGLGEVGCVAEPVAAAAYFASVLGRTVPVGGRGVAEFEECAPTGRRRAG